MVAIAKAIIAQRTGAFDPSTYRDRYQEALRELIEAKMKGLPLNPQKSRPRVIEYQPHRRGDARRDRPAGRFRSGSSQDRKMAEPLLGIKISKV